MKHFLLSTIAVCLITPSLTAVAAPAKYLLQAELPAGTTSRVTVKLETGGDLLMPTDEEGIKKLPMKVACDLDYVEQLVAWAPESSAVARAIRQYNSAVGNVEVADKVTQRALADERKLILAEVRDGQSVVTGGEANLTREQVDLLNEVGNTLAIDRLLPGKEMAEGESWRHDADTLGALLAMDHVAVCEVASVVTEEADRQVKIRLAGTVHGTVDGTVVERELRAAYLFHLDQKRIVRFNLAIKDGWKSNAVAPGMDVVTKVFIAVHPAEPPSDLPPAVKQIASRTGEPLSRTLVYESPAKNFRFAYSDAWYITAEERDRVSLRYLSDHEEGAFCTVIALPARSAGRQTPLQQFELDVRALVGKNLEAVSASTEWDTQRGHHCLGVVADGKVNEIPMQWRHYLVSADDCPRLSLAVSLERGRVERFADAERQLIDSIELVPTPPAETASKGEAISR